MFGQYSPQFVGRKTKRDMVAGAARRHPDSTILDARKIANNTLAYRVPESGTSFIALHDTDVLAWGDHGVVAVDTGGYNTVTTRARLNEFGGRLGVRVHTAKGVLHVNGVPCHRRAWVYPDGKVKTDMNEKKLDRLRSELDGFMAEWKRKGLPTDGAGDPWIIDPWIISDSISEETMLDWVRSRYVFRSFAAMAFQFSGLTEYGAHLWLHDIDRNGGKLDRLQLGKIRRFARRHMGLA